MTLSKIQKIEKIKERKLKVEILETYFERFFQLTKNLKQKDAYNQLESEFYKDYKKHRYSTFRGFQRGLYYHRDKY